MVRIRRKIRALGRAAGDRIGKAVIIPHIVAPRADALHRICAQVAYDGLFEAVDELIARRHRGIQRDLLDRHGIPVRQLRLVFVAKVGERQPQLSERRQCLVGSLVVIAPHKHDAIHRDVRRDQIGRTDGQADLGIVFGQNDALQLAAAIIVHDRRTLAKKIIVAQIELELHLDGVPGGQPVFAEGHGQIRTAGDIGGLQPPDLDVRRAVVRIRRKIRALGRAAGDRIGKAVIIPHVAAVKRTDALHRIRAQIAHDGLFQAAQQRIGRRGGRRPQQGHRQHRQQQRSSSQQGHCLSIYCFVHAIHPLVCLFHRRPAKKEPIRS